MFTVSSTLIRAVLTGPTDWFVTSEAVRRGGCIELYYFNMVEWFWWDSSLISMTDWLSSVLWHCWFGHLACKNHPQNDLLCVEWDVKSLHYYTTLSVKMHRNLTKPQYGLLNLLDHLHWSIPSSHQFIQSQYHKPLFSAHCTSLEE